MRARIVVLAIVFGVVGVGQSLGTVRDGKVLLYFDNPPVNLAIGQTHTMTLRFEAYGDVLIDGIEMNSPNWAPTPLDLARPARMSKGQSRDVRFQVTRPMALEPLEIKYRVDGKEHSTEFNPDDSWWQIHESKRVGDSLPRKIPSSERPVPAVDPPSPSLAEQDPSFLGKDVDPEVTTHTVRVVGRIIFSRQREASGLETDRIDVGADGAIVRVFDWNNYIDLELASVHTDEAGYFDVEFTWYTWIGSDVLPDLYVTFESNGLGARVSGKNSAYPYTWYSETEHDYNGSFLDVGELRAGDDAVALQIQTSIARTQRWYLEETGTLISNVGAFYPEGTTSAWYLSESESIHISTFHAWIEETHAHEYGHHITHMEFGIPIPDYCNGFCDLDPPDNCSHCPWCEENEHDAWSEGFANWISDAVTNDWHDRYVHAPQYTRNAETLQTCNDGNYHDSLITEGPFHALLRDIQDNANEVDRATPSFRDRLNLGTAEIFNTLDNIYIGLHSPATFISKFMELYPEHAEAFWETAANCGYNSMDDTPPSTPTPTTTHSGTPSPDATISFYWPPATDDLSGIAGYTFELNEGAPVAPGTGLVDMPATQLEYHSPVLSPGTYYFTLRAIDRDSNPGGYVALGPLVIRDAEPGDLHPFAGSGWDYPLVPRGAADVGIGGVPAPVSILPQSTYWNLNIINSGEVDIPSGTQTAVLVDGFPLGATAAPLMYAFGHEDPSFNMGPISIRGGRHTLEGRADNYENEPEADEANNDWGRQWIWSPELLYGPLFQNRVSPPISDAGWESVTGQALYYNCDGLRFLTSVSGPVAAAYILPENSLQDYDLRLHAAATSATSGFGSNLGYSGRPARCIDAVLTNTTGQGTVAHDIGVLNHTGVIGDGYYVEAMYAVPLTLDTPLAATFTSGQAMKLYRFDITPATQGSQSIQLSVDTTWNYNRVHMAWYDESFTNGDLLDYDGIVSVDTTGYGQIDIDAQPGTHTLAVWRDPKDGSLSLRDFTVAVGQPPADLTYRQPYGWDAPIVPRPAQDATASWAPLPVTLPGDTSSTYFNYSFANTSAGASGSFDVELYLDGVQIKNTGSPGLPGDTGHTVLGGATTVSGGRHTVTMRIDRLDNEAELNESNNTYGSQFVWEPAPLTIRVPVYRQEPMPRTAHWEYATGSQDLWYSGDGVRTPTFVIDGQDGYWGVVAVIPGELSDVDLRLHPVSSGVQDGFTVPLASSDWGPSQSEFIIVNFHATADRTFDAAIIRGLAAKDVPYRVAAYPSKFRGTVSKDGFGPYFFNSGAMVNLHEINLSTAGRYRIEVNPTSGNADLGISLYGNDEVYYSKSDPFDDGVNGPAIAWTEPIGSSESIEFEITEPGLYCLAVWKVGSADSEETAWYDVDANIVAPSSIGDVDTPRATRLVGAYPNPFNPQTRIAFELATEGHLLLQVFDLRGRLVRTLSDERRGAGRHELTWDGRNHHGNGVASGSYLVKLNLGGVDDYSRVTLVR